MTECPENVVSSSLEDAVRLLEGSTIMLTTQTPGMVCHKVVRADGFDYGMTGFMIFCTDGFAILIHDAKAGA